MQQRVYLLNMNATNTHNKILEFGGCENWSKKFNLEIHFLIF